jgi:hypothetical protein
VGTRFQVLFHSPSGVLFTFPSRYSFTIGRQEYLALDGGPPSFPHGDLPRGTQVVGHGGRFAFAYRAVTFSGPPFQAGSASERLGNSAGALRRPVGRPLQPPPRNGRNLSRWVGLGSSPFARHYSGNALFSSGY